ncbi:MAG: hypothetical protein AAGA76_13270, partial [Pseudomonadota bacterium]
MDKDINHRQAKIVMPQPYLWWFVTVLASLSVIAYGFALAARPETVTIYALFLPVILLLWS